MRQLLRSVLLLLLATLCLSRPCHAQRDAQVPDPDPEEERKALQLPDGFEINLFAADPLIAKPTQMNFDPQGRLWVASSEVYPQIAPGQKQNDKILILEDTTGTGKADKVTVFADGLLIPTGVEPGDGGAYVADSTELVHLSASTPGGKADRRRVMLSGFGTEDTHHIVHTLRWGPDGMLYFNQSIYIHSHIETPYGVKHLNAGGIWQFRPETMQLNVLMRGLVNSWGHHFDAYGQSFATDGAGNGGINYVFPGVAFFTNEGVPEFMQGLNPGSPKYCGLEILSGSHLPPEYVGNIITNDFRAHRVCRFQISDDGAGFSSKQLPELIKSKHPAFRPIDVKMGPDGAIYIADWYNPIIQHGEVDFRDPRRDHTHGRIWRITAKNRPLVERPKLLEATNAQLFAFLSKPEGWTRQNAKRVLKERGADKVLADLDAWWKTIDAQQAGGEPLLLEALWTYQSLDIVNAALLKNLLQAKQPEIRAAALRVAGQWQNRLDNPLAIIRPLIADPHPRVRLEAVRALANIPSIEAAEAAMRALDKPTDKFLDYGLWLTARDLQDVWLPAMQSGKVTFGGSAKQLAFALESTGVKEAVGPLMALLKKGELDAAQEENALLSVATLGGPPELGKIFDLTLQTAQSEPARAANLLAALIKASQQRKQNPAGDLTRLSDLMASATPAVRKNAIRAAGVWKVESLRAKVLEIARGTVTGDDSAQVAAIDSLASLGGAASQTALAELAEKSSLPQRSAAVAALSSIDLPRAARLAAPIIRDVATADAAAKDANMSTVIEAFLRRKGGAAALAAELNQTSIPADAAKLAVRALRATAIHQPALEAALLKAGKVTSAAKTYTAEDIKQLLADVKTSGDPARGEQIFRRAELNCLKCHAIGGAGGQVGPDLISVGASAPVDYLLESILLPSAKIKEGYQTLLVNTDDGRVVSGVKLRQSDKDLNLRTVDDKELAIPLESIESQANGPSLMPVGLADTLTKAELTDLVRFLSELGKVGPYSISKTPYVRRWQVETPAGWSSIYSEVSGTLPPTTVEAALPKNAAAVTTRLRFQVEVTTPGRVALDGLSDAAFKIDDRPLDTRPTQTVELTTGLHTVTLAINAKQREATRRIELQDVPGSPARARLLGGK